VIPGYITQPDIRLLVLLQSAEHGAFFLARFQVLRVEPERLLILLKREGELPHAQQRLSRRQPRFQLKHACRRFPGENQNIRNASAPLRNPDTALPFFLCSPELVYVAHP
jgi:hypothetical protein